MIGIMVSMYQCSKDPYMCQVRIWNDMSSDTSKHKNYKICSYACVLITKQGNLYSMLCMHGGTCTWLIS